MTYNKDTIQFLPKPTTHNFIDLTSHIFGRLTVLGYAGRSASKRQEWFCECECGNITKARQGNLHSKQVLSCGCLRDEKIQRVNQTHGLAKHPLYITWCNIRRRCYEINFPKYQTHGKRGIRVYQRWRNSFTDFLADMSEKSSRTHSIERIDNNAHYSCGHCDECIKNGWVANCKWATPKEQSKNQRTNRTLTFNGKTQILADWARELNIPYACLSRRLNGLKWSDEKALITPVQR